MILSYDFVCNDLKRDLSVLISPLDQWLEGVLCANICAENLSSFLFLVTIGVLENMRWILPTPAISEKIKLFDMTRLATFCA